MTQFGNQLPGSSSPLFPVEDVVLEFGTNEGADRRSAQQADLGILEDGLIFQQAVISRSVQLLI